MPIAQAGDLRGAVLLVVPESEVSGVVEVDLVGYYFLRFRVSAIAVVERLLFGTAWRWLRVFPVERHFPSFWA